MVPAGQKVSSRHISFNGKNTHEWRIGEIYQIKLLVDISLIEISLKGKIIFGIKF
jgi:hypothetical protein